MQVIEDICKCRNALETRDFKTILKYIPVFDRVCNSAKIQVDRFIKNEKYEINFNYHDLKELSEEIFAYVKNFQNKFTFSNYQKELCKTKTIDNVVLREFTQKQCDLMFVDRKLRESYKILNYFAMVVWLWTEAREQEELDWQVTQAIRSFL
jgi:hypothetical protein